MSGEMEGWKEGGRENEWRDGEMDGGLDGEMIEGWRERSAEKLWNQNDGLSSPRSDQIELLISPFPPTHTQTKTVSKRIYFSEQPQRPFKESGRLCWKYINQQPDTWELGLWGSAGKCSKPGPQSSEEGARFLISASPRYKGHRPEEAVHPFPPHSFLCNTRSASAQAVSSKPVSWRSPMTSLLLTQMAFSFAPFSSSPGVYCLSKSFQRQLTQLTSFWNSLQPTWHCTTVIPPSVWVKGNPLRMEKESWQ